jgi:hypothetical protein
MQTFVHYIGLSAVCVLIQTTSIGFKAECQCPYVFLNKLIQGVHKLTKISMSPLQM